MRALGVAVAFPGGDGDRLLELAHLEGERLVRVDGEGRTVEDQFVLPAKLVGIDHRQAGLDDLLDHHLMAHVDLGAVIGRAVGDQKDFGAAFGQCLAHAEFAPDVLADRHADADATKIERSGDLRTSLEHALFVELAIVRQVHLVALAEHLAAVGEEDRIVGAALALQRRADDDGRPAIGGVLGQFIGGAFASRQERRLQHQILRRIAGNEQFGEQDEIRPLAGGVRSRRARLG